VDYEFSYDLLGQPIAQFSMGHEAIGRWFCEELCNNQQRIDELLNIIEQIEQRCINQRRLIGSEFELHIDINEVEIFAQTLNFDVVEDLPEDTNLYDEESHSGCGLPDFKQALLSWKTFVS